MALSSEMRTALAEELWDAARAGGNDDRSEPALRGLHDR